MTVRLTTALLAMFLAGAVLMNAKDALANGGPLGIEHNLVTKTITWVDQDNEVAYRISGSIVYQWGELCGGVAFGGTVEFSEELPADIVSFALPLPEDAPADATVKEMDITLEALASDGEVLEGTGFALIVDGLCFDEALPATGTGPNLESSSSFPLGLAILGIFGLVCLAGGLVMLGKRV